MTEDWGAIPNPTSDWRDEMEEFYILADNTYKQLLEIAENIDGFLPENFTFLHDEIAQENVELYTIMMQIKDAMSRAKNLATNLSETYGFETEEARKAVCPHCGNQEFSHLIETKRIMEVSEIIEWMENEDPIYSNNFSEEETPGNIDFFYYRCHNCNNTFEDPEWVEEEPS
jgi:DNA-directed RNA polymerase subunit M/transcription elongation factor TFIIS